jgi:hypothetical protein
MKRIFGLVTTLVALTLASSAWAFTAGNIVVYRMGDGTATGLTNLGARVFLDEYQTNGTLASTTAMPTNYFGAFSPLIGSGTAAADGFLTLSKDGRFLVLTGWGATLGQFTNKADVLPGLLGTQAPRVVAVVDGAGHIDTTTVLTNSDIDGSSIRSAASTDGTNLWFSGDPFGINYVLRGTNDQTQLSPQSNVRMLNIFSNQLYWSSASSFGRVGTAGPGLPTTGGQLYTNLPGYDTSAGSPYHFVFVKQNPATAQPVDTLYVADEFAGVIKWSLFGGNWVSNGIVTCFRPRGVTAVVLGPDKVQLFVTGGGGTLTGFDRISTAVDGSGYNQTPTANADDTIIVAGVSLKNLRGIAFAPVGSEASPTNSGSGRLSVGPILRFNSAGFTGGPFSPSSKAFSVANPGTATISYTATVDSNFVTVGTLSSSLAGGASANVTLSINANANTLDGGNAYTATVTFANTTSAPDDKGTTTRQVVLTIDALNVTPTAFFHAAGPVGGPFTTNYVYNITNSASSTAGWAITNTSTWLVYSATNGNLLGHTSTNITFSIGSAANGFSRGPNLDVITFRDTTRNKDFDTRNATLQVGVGFFDDFCVSPYINGDLAGQQNWYEGVGAFTTSTRPIQINACQAWEDPAVPTGTDWQQVAKDFGSINMSSNDVFAGFVITVTNASSVAIPSYNIGLDVNPGDLGGDNPNYRNYRLNAQSTGGGFHFGTRANGFSAGPVYGAARTFGTAYNVIIRAHQGGTNMTTYVNPTSAVLGAQVADATDAMTGGYPATLGAVALNQYAGNGGGLAGMGIGKVSVSTNYADVYNELNGIIIITDPFTSWQNQYFGCTGCPQAAGGADPDGDGMSNTNEFLAGFAPTTNSASLRVISVATTSVTNITVTYRGASGNSTTTPPSASRTNVLEFATGTANGSYTNANFVSIGDGGTNVLSGGDGSGQIACFIHTTGASGETKYYRVRVLVP